MKFVWEDSDIVVGSRYSREGVREVWMIGYLPALDERRYVSISLSDGMVTHPLYKHEMALSLTGQEYVPEKYLKV
jgi:hypothetical protein